MWFKASAPGSLMLLGEHAVLEGGNALVAAVNHRMSVTLIPRIDTLLTISSQLGTFTSEISQFKVQPPFQFVLTALKKYQTLFPSGFDLVIESEFSDQIGFASSAAVTVATLHALHTWLALSVTKSQFILEAREMIREVQGIGSGADVAACVLGGIVAYRAEPFSVEKISYDYPLTAIYSGSKTKTVDVIQHVKKYFADKPDQLKEIFKAINECAEQGIVAAREINHVELGNAMNRQQILMDNLQVNTSRLKEIIHYLHTDKSILGAKISGSGLGDCVVGLGAFNQQDKDFDLIPIKISPEGVYCEKN